MKSYFIWPENWDWMIIILRKKAATYKREGFLSSTSFRRETNQIRTPNSHSFPPSGKEALLGTFNGQVFLVSLGLLNELGRSRLSESWPLHSFFHKTHTQSGERNILIRYLWKTKDLDGNMVGVLDGKSLSALHNLIFLSWSFLGMYTPEIEHRYEQLPYF